MYPILLGANAVDEIDAFKGKPEMKRQQREYVRFEVTDFNSKSLSKMVPARHRENGVYLFHGAITLGANAEVMALPDEVVAAGCGNTELLPDWKTEQVLPWACKPEKGIVVKRVYCEQSQVQMLPRTICRNLLDELKRDFKGLELLVGGELEFVMAKPSTTAAGWEPWFEGPEIFTTLQGCKAMDFCFDLEQNMEQVGVDILTMNSEYGAGQLELTFVPKFGIDAADMTVTFRTGTKEMAQERGLRATFMAKPFGVSGVGSGGHFNFSLWLPAETESAGHDIVGKVTAGHRNAFHDSEDSDGLSATARCFLAGVLAHAPAMEAICSPTPPCYCRHGNWAPTVANWGVEDRAACVRVKSNPKGAPGSCYMEFRMPSASANPYLVMAAITAAGIDGMQRRLELPPARQTAEQGAAVLPKTLADALTSLEADDYMVKKLGPDFVRWYAGVKRAEMKRIDELLVEGRDLGSVWQHMYMEFV
eukprot:TRINITY_DN5546_c0_g2_i1.p1 TRINITY_DN5546_c0_g2~~TRINITY_DN5546_c0_g2_i1.p1  ORF type:complete len:477 (-),score=88.73 TRINITY_DN5546_c0_g2_i1:220-1650(-)